MSFGFLLRLWQMFAIFAIDTKYAIFAKKPLSTLSRFFGQIQHFCHCWLLFLISSYSPLSNLNICQTYAEFLWDLRFSPDSPFLSDLLFSSTSLLYKELLLWSHLSNDLGKAESNFFCYAATVLSPHRNVLIFTKRMHKPTGRPFTQ